MQEVESAEDPEMHKYRLDDAWKSLKAQASVLRRFQRLVGHIKAHTDEMTVKLREGQDRFEMESHERHSSDLEQGIDSALLDELASVKSDETASTSPTTGS